MPVADADRKLVDQVFEAMHARAAGEQKMMALFAESAVLTEPFSGAPRTHTGKKAIREWFLQAVNEMPPDMKIKMDRIDMDGAGEGGLDVHLSSVFGVPMKGSDFYTIRNGLIEKAEFVVTDMPPMAQ